MLVTTADLCKSLLWSLTLEIMNILDHPTQNQKTGLPEAAILAIENCVLMQQKAKEWQEELDNWQDLYPTAEKERIILFSIPVPSPELSGYAYPDKLLNKYKVISQLMLFRITKVRCYLKVNLNHNLNSGVVNPDYSIHLEILTEYLDFPIEGHEQNISFHFDIQSSCMNWVSEKDSSKIGFGQYCSGSNNKTGMAFIFNDDSFRIKIIEETDKKIKLINEKFNKNFHLFFCSAEKFAKERLRLIVQS